MSLVETALKKMQEAGRSGADRPTDAHKQATLRTDPRAPGVIGELVRASASASHAEAALEDGRRGSTKWIRVDRQALRQEGLLAPEHQDRLLADEFRHIKRPLIAAAIGRGSARTPNGQIIMMASALPGEGKTFTSINLALSISLDRDVSVLLIDADVTKPHVTKTFGLEDEPGLLDVLRDEALDAESTILPTDVPGLSVLPAGKRAKDAAELLASQRMADVMAALLTRDPNRIVIVDSSPLLLTNESRVLAHLAGQIVLVVRAGTTLQRAVLDAIDLLSENKSISLVLNQARGAAMPLYYGYPEAQATSSS